MMPTLVIALYCLLIVAASLTGGWLPGVLRLTHARMQLMISFVGGMMLGVGLWHLLPHSVVELGSLDRSLLWVMIGLLTMFFLIRAFQFHQHDLVVTPDDNADELHGQHDHGHAEQSGDGHDHHHGSPTTHHLSWLGIAFGLAVHTMIDGVALAASVQAEASDAETFGFFGAATFAAIVLHKPLDALSITSLMAAGGWSLRARQIINASFALMCPIGAGIFYVSVDRFVEQQHVAIGCALGFSAGVFLCISLGDLLPEVQFHAHDRIKLSIALVAGIVMAYGIGLLEPEGLHHHVATGGHGQTQDSDDTSSDDHHPHEH